MATVNAVRRAIVGVLGLLFLAGCGGADLGTVPDTGTGRSAVVRIAAASDLRFVLKEIKIEFAKANPNIDMKLSFGSSRLLVGQIQNGAPFDVYLSADNDSVQQLRDQGLASAQDTFSYAVGRLAVWAPRTSRVDPTVGLRALLDPAVTKIAIANPDHAPYGRAAVQAMRSAGVYDAVRDRFVRGENIAHAGQFVYSGNTQVGIIALSLALAEPYQQSGRYAVVPFDFYEQITQAGAILSRAPDLKAAHAVKDFLLGAQGARIFKRYGFDVPGSRG